MSGILAPLVAPIDGESAVGEDPRNTEEFEAISLELAKIGGVDLEPVDWSVVAQNAEHLLTKHGKDLRCGVYWGIAKVAQDGPTQLGLAVELLSGLIDAFGEEIHPRRPRGRKSIVSWFAERLDIELAPGSLVFTTDEQRALLEQLEGLAGALRRIEVDATPIGRVQGLVTERGAVHLSDDEQRKKALSQFEPEFAELAVAILEHQSVVEKTARGLRLRRFVFWDAVPEIIDSVADVEVGKSDELLDLLAGQAWNDLLARSEELFPSTPFWLDLTYFSWKAAIHVFGRQAAQGIVGVLRDLLTRAPELVTALDASGGPLASDDTRAWIEEAVLISKEGEGSADETLPKEVRALLEEGRLPEALTEASAWIAHPEGRVRFSRSVAIASAFSSANSATNSHTVFRGLHNHLRQMTVKEWDPPIFAACIRGFLLTKRDSMGLGPEDEHLMDELSAMDPASLLSILSTD